MCQLPSPKAGLDESDIVVFREVSFPAGMSFEKILSTNNDGHIVQRQIILLLPLNKKALPSSSALPLFTLKSEVQILLGIWHGEKIEDGKRSSWFSRNQSNVP